MKILDTHRALGISTSDEGFEHLVSTLRESIRFWDYFVNWPKAFANADAARELVRKWDVVTASANFEQDLRSLIENVPEIVTTIPILAVRDGSTTQIFQIADNPREPLKSIREYDFSRPASTPELVDNAIHFLNMSGISAVLRTRIQGSVYDYVLGVEAGLDSNGRKNRGGTAMEAAAAQHISEVCETLGLRFMDQATDEKIVKDWGRAGTGIPGRRYDFAIENGDQLVILEVNFYSAGGSKLKATAGEYKELAPRLHESGATFVWITDGVGWKTAKVPLRSAYMEIDNVFNLDLLADGCLIDVLSV